MPARFYEDDIGVMATLSAQYHTSGSNSMAGNTGTSRLAMMQARLREQLMVEKESRLLEMAARQEAQRQGTIQRVTKSSASSLSSSLSSLSSSGGQGRVRKLFEERRHNGFNHSPVGWDKSYPLEPVRGGHHGGGGGGGGGRPPVKPAKGAVRNNRGVSVDRAKANYDPAAMRRSRSHAALQRNNNINNNNSSNGTGGYNNYSDPRSPQRGLRPPQARPPAHHKSTSSLLDANQNYNGRGSSGSSGGYSRGPSRDASPSPSHTNANRFGFRSRGPSPAPPQAPRRSQTFNAHRAQQDEVDSRGSPEQRPPPRRPAQPPRQAPARQPLRQPRQSRPPARQPSPEPEHDEDDKVFMPSPRVNRSKSRGPPITQVASYNGEDSLPKPVAKSKPKLPPKPKAASQATTPRSRITSSVPAGLEGCKICGRNFASDRLEKHQSICAKTQAKAKKRKQAKVFDPVKMRTKGTEAEKYVKRGAHLKELPKPKKADWRKKHEDFIATVRAAKGVKGYEAPPMDTSDYVQCPHCGRKFSGGVADRHIPKCASIQSNKPAGGRRR
ncbi:zinc finger C2HC domain-containing protein 1C-like isoform X3 [Penaeus japonicus]|uniref:zinc finger C2HC domain-containing protein 1C-like isoform X3 n=1 Tax=Penaeus japonicus TaxID=27405 RepID=UPI001C70C00D|nr:zinc finger C2HC domain-containing protein 1C-like isoform X3 [Penaeus japonicus]